MNKNIMQDSPYPGPYATAAPLSNTLPPASEEDGKSWSVTEWMIAQREANKR